MGNAIDGKLQTRFCVPCVETAVSLCENNQRHEETRIKKESPMNQPLDLSGIEGAIAEVRGLRSEMEQQLSDGTSRLCAGLIG